MRNSIYVIKKVVNDWDLNRNIIHFHTNRTDKMPPALVPKNISVIQIHTKNDDFLDTYFLYGFVITVVFLNKNCMYGFVKTCTLP